MSDLLCFFCGRATTPVDVHGHIQCEHCTHVICECCTGECAHHERSQDGPPEIPQAEG